MKFLAAVTVLAATVAAGPIEARQRDGPGRGTGRGAVWSSWDLYVSSDYREIDGLPVGTLADFEEGITRVGLYKGQQTPLRVETIENAGEPARTVSIGGGIIEHALALQGTEESTLRQLIDVDTPAAAEGKSYKYGYQGFTISGGEEKGGALTYQLLWGGQGEGEWRAFPSRIPEVGWDIKWVSKDAWITANSFKVQPEIRLRAQS